MIIPILMKILKSKRPPDNRSQAVGAHHPFQRPVALVVVPPRADSAKEAPIRIIRIIESSCVFLHTNSRLMGC